MKALWAAIRIAFFFALVFVLIFVPALSTPAWASPGTEAIARTVEAFLTERAASLPGRVTIEIGAIIDNDRYAACQQWEAFLQGGVRPWGKVSVGARCVAGNKASLYVPATIRVDGPYLVAARGIPAGQVLAREDFKFVEGELSAQAPDLLTSEPEALGLAARSFIPADRPLRSSLLRQEMAVLAGQTVKLVARGEGFSVSYEGQAISSAAIGQSVRVRAPNGTILTAIVVDKGVVEAR